MHTQLMHHFMILALALAWLAILAGGWLGWQLLRQNGRLLLRLEDLEQRLDQLTDHSPPTSAAITVNGRSGRFGNRSLAQSKIKRDG